MRLVAGADYDPKAVEHTRAMIRWFAQTGQYDLIRQQCGRGVLIDILREAAQRAITKPPSKTYRVLQKMATPKGVLDRRVPEDMVSDEEVQAWMDEDFARTGVKPKVARCLAWLDRDFGMNGSKVGSAPRGKCKEAA